MTLFRRLFSLDAAPTNYISLQMHFECAFLPISNPIRRCMHCHWLHILTNDTHVWHGAAALPHNLSLSCQLCHTSIGPQPMTSQAGVCWRAGQMRAHLNTPTPLVSRLRAGHPKCCCSYYYFCSCFFLHTA